MKNELTCKIRTGAERFLTEFSKNGEFKKMVTKSLCAFIGGVAAACTILQILEPQAWHVFVRFLLGNLAEGTILTCIGVTVFFDAVQRKQKAAYFFVDILCNTRYNVDTQQREETQHEY